MLLLKLSREHMQQQAAMTCLQSNQCQSAYFSRCRSLAACLQQVKGIYCSQTPTDASHTCMWLPHRLETVKCSVLQACTSLEVDIITFDLAKRLPFRLKPGPLQTALKRGLFFEVQCGSSHRLQLCTHLFPAWCCFGSMSVIQKEVARSQAQVEVYPTLFSKGH